MQPTNEEPFSEKDLDEWNLHNAIMKSLDEEEQRKLDDLLDSRGITFDDYIAEKEFKAQQALQQHKEITEKKLAEEIAQYCSEHNITDQEYKAIKEAELEEWQRTRDQHWNLS